MNEVNVKINELTDDEKTSSIYVEFRLYDALDAEFHFDLIEGEDFENFKPENGAIIEDINAVDCSRRCLDMENCGAYSHIESKSICKVWIIEDFNKLKKKSGKNFDFSKYFRTIKNEISRLGKRIGVYYYPKHCLNNKLIEAMKTKVKDEKLDLKFYDSDKIKHLLKAKDVKSNRSA